MSATFDRWSCWFPTTWSYRLFRKHQTELNTLYWAGAVASAYSERHARGAADESDTAKHFGISGSNVHRFPKTTSDWLPKFRSHCNFGRLNAAIAICSYLEVYLQSVAALSLESDPGLLLAAPRALDGVRLLRARTSYDMTPKTDSFVKGTWQQRAAYYKKVFGSIPTELSSSIGELDRLRRLRNGVAHAFGRAPDDYRSLLDLEPKPMQRLSESRLQKWLGISNKVAMAVDAHLRDSHIGAYELLRFYHYWPGRKRGARADRARPLKRLLGQLGAEPPIPLRYAKAAISHYYAA